MSKVSVSGIDLVRRMFHLHRACREGCASSQREIVDRMKIMQQLLSEFDKEKLYRFESHSHTNAELTQMTIFLSNKVRNRLHKALALGKSRIISRASSYRYFGGSQVKPDV